ncbi:MazG family protein [Demequina sp. SYSU T00192]|uniref:MazG family protein n=1 Tax=Demequina litoralis TaxID=3051660 RepID=A0ABT8G8X7_9MICO|nr:MazG family protein [Demequina sp. SYSU T00192]MDN4475595.1 MazG family protein [Demequina sp. SYSU T00192]
MTDGIARLVEVMDRLRSPGGCEWDAEQTHESLAPYALEEAHELVEAIESGSRAHLREELGDVLLQVVFHARVAQEHPTEPFGFDDVADACADKLIARHPHVFGDEEAGTMDEHLRRWDRIKAETSGRESVMDGIPASLGALARAQKVLGRAERAGLDAPAGGDGVGDALLALVRRAAAEGLDAETELRAATRRLEQAARAQEQAGRSDTEGSPG